MVTVNNLENKSIEEIHNGNKSVRQTTNSLNDFSKTNFFNYSTSQIKQLIGLQWLENQGYTGKGVTIGFIDTGINNSIVSNEFGTRLLAQKSFVTTTNNYADNDTTLIDTIGHGTEVASLAVGANYGMASGANLVSAKIYSENITGNGGYKLEETTRGVYYGILYCVEHNASIINLSMGQYSNIVNDGRQYIINKMSKEHNIIFTIAAGNSGFLGIDGGSLGTPGTAFQAITVAASNGSTNMAYFSSSGIRNDYTVKPDVSAPGFLVDTINGPGAGTSLATPLVAGGIAVLIEALVQAGRNYTVGAIKSALVETANPIGDDPIWYQGAGLVNFTAAYNLLMAKPTLQNIPIIASVFPKELPISPLNNLFVNQTVPFNVTVMSSQYDQATISLHGIPNDTMSFNTVQYFNASQRLSIWFHPRADTIPGEYNGYLLIDFALGPKINITIKFTVKIPRIKVLFDESKNGFVNYKPDRTPWGDSEFLLGQYREFYNLLATNNISLTPFESGHYTNITYLKEFDVIMFPNPNTKVTNPFTDWYNDPIFGNTFKLTEPTLLFTKEELTTLNTYVKDYGKGILILASFPEQINRTAFDSFLKALNVGYTLGANKIQQAPYTISSNNRLFTSVKSLDYFGSDFIPDLTNSNTTALEENKILLLNNLTFSSSNKGRVLVSGSSYFAENYRLDGRSNGNYPNDANFVLNMFSWLNGKLDPIIPSQTTTATTQNVPTSSTITTSILSNPNTSSTGTKAENKSSNLDLLSIVVAIPVITAIKKKFISKK